MTYKIIEGLPTAVEKEVQEHIALGWRLNGQCFPRIHDGYHLVVQSVVKDEPLDPNEPDRSVEPPPFSTSLTELIARVQGSPENK